MERRTGVGIERDVTGQYGPGHISRNQVDGKHLHLWVGRVQRRCRRRIEPTLQRSHSVLPAITTICGGGYPAVQAQLRRIPDDNGEAAMVHHWMLSCPRRHLGYRKCHRSDQGAPPGSQIAGAGEITHQLGRSRGRLEGGGDCGSIDDGGARRHVVPLPPTMTPMVTGQEDAEHGPGGYGGAVTDGLHSRDR